MQSAITSENPRVPLVCACLGVFSGGRSVLRHQDLRGSAALEAFRFYNVQVQVICELGGWALPRADRNRDRRQLVFGDRAQTRQRPGEVWPAVDQDGPCVVARLAQARSWSIAC
jgi:hypothetical protein